MERAERRGWPRLVAAFLAYWLPVLVWMGLIFFLSSRSDLPNPAQPGTLGNDLVAKTAHVVVYALLTGLLWRALAHGRRPTAWVACAAFALAALYGLSDELHQAFVPGREATLLDAGIDAGAALVAVVCLTWARQVARVRNSKEKAS